MGSNLAARDRTKDNKLTFAQQVDLGNALRKYRDKFDRERVSAARAAEFLTGKLGFKVTLSNLMSVRNGLNVVWRSRGGSGGQGARGPYAPKVARVLGQALLDIYIRQGWELPADLVALLRQLEESAPEGEGEGEGEGAEPEGGGGS